MTSHFKTARDDVERDGYRAKRRTPRVGDAENERKTLILNDRSMDRARASAVGAHAAVALARTRSRQPTSAGPGIFNASTVYVFFDFVERSEFSPSSFV